MSFIAKINEPEKNRFFFLNDLQRFVYEALGISNYLTLKLQ